MRKLLAALLVGLFAPTAVVIASQSFTFTVQGRNNRTYTVTTTKLKAGVLALTGHWMYQPSVILPSAATGYKYVMLFNSNADGGSTADQALFLSTSYTPDSFPAPQRVLYQSQTSNICDMADARPFWDGSSWHVYVQARQYSGGVCEYAGYTFEATGPTLSNLSWVYDYGTHAKVLTYPRAPETGVGVGEDLQWYHTGPYLGAPDRPILYTYNDWTYSGQDCRPNNPYGSYVCSDYCPNCAFNGTEMFAYLSPNGTDPLYFWYYREPGWGPASNPTLMYPDVILADSLDSSTLGNPGVGMQSRCLSSSDQYQHARGIGFYNDPVPYYARDYQGGHVYDGPLEGITNDSYGAEARMFRPRFARNEYGYLEPYSDSPKQWRTYLYYTDSSVTDGTPGEPCGTYFNWINTQRFSVSEVVITEQ